MTLSSTVAWIIGIGLAICLGLALWIWHAVIHAPYIYEDMSTYHNVKEGK